MIRMVSPWAPLVMPRHPAMGQQLTPLVPPAPPPGTGLMAIGAGATVLALSAVSVLFAYGVARESSSRMVKTTGYILAGVGALAALVEAVGVGVAVSKAA